MAKEKKKLAIYAVLMGMTRVAVLDHEIYYLPDFPLAARDDVWCVQELARRGYMRRYLLATL